MEVGRLYQYVCAPGMCYFRLRSTSTSIDPAGIDIGQLTVDIRDDD